MEIHHDWFGTVDNSVSEVCWALYVEGNITTRLCTKSSGGGKAGSVVKGRLGAMPAKGGQGWKVC